MRFRRLFSILGVGAVVTGAAVAQPKAPAKKDDKKTAPAKDAKAPAKDAKDAKAPAKDAKAPAKDAKDAKDAKGTPAATPATPDAGSAAAAPPPEEPPPKDMEGRDENPGNPGGLTVEAKIEAPPPKKKLKSGYPIEEAQRPINLPANMSEVSIGPHAQLGLGSDTRYAGADALRARYGITRQVQLGLTYLMAGIYDDPSGDVMDTGIGVHGGKAVGLDITVLLQDWIGIRVGVPVYIKPVAVSLTIGAPIKFTLAEKFAIGGLDDLLNIRLKRFAPTFYQEASNAAAAQLDSVNGVQSDGQLRFSAFGVYNRNPKTAIIGRIGANLEDFKTTAGGMGGAGANAGLTYFLRAGANYSPRKYLDLGFSLGWDDLSDNGSFGPAGFLAFRI